MTKIVLYSKTMDAYLRNYSCKRGTIIYCDTVFDAKNFRNAVLTWFIRRKLESVFGVDFQIKNFTVKETDNAHI